MKGFSVKPLIWITMLFLGLLPYQAFGLGLTPGNFDAILDTHVETLTVWQLAENNKIYVFDFHGLVTQGKTFNRITHLTEQIQANAGYPRVLTTDEFIKYMDSLRRTQADFAFGHDLLVSELVLFYNLADRDKIDLLPEEIVLRTFLLDQGLIKVWRNFYQSVQSDVVILSIPQEQPHTEGTPPVSKLARQAIFLHELSHGEYYTNPHFAAYCRLFWNQSLNDAQRRAFVNLFKKYNYNTASGELMVNEMQAYLMFTPDPQSFSASKLGVTEGELASMRDMFRRGRPPTRLPLR